MSHPSAWGDDPIDVVVEPPQVHPPLAPPQPIPVAPSTGMVGTNGEVTGTDIQRVVAIAMQACKPKSRGFSYLAQKIGIHNSLLLRLSKGVGTLRTVDSVAQKLGWEITIKWK